MAVIPASELLAKVGLGDNRKQRAREVLSLRWLYLLRGSQLGWAVGLWGEGQDHERDGVLLDGRPRLTERFPGNTKVEQFATRANVHLLVNLMLAYWGVKDSGGDGKEEINAYGVGRQSL